MKVKREIRSGFNFVLFEIPDGFCHADVVGKSFPEAPAYFLWSHWSGLHYWLRETVGAHAYHSFLRLCCPYLKEIEVRLGKKRGRNDTFLTSFVRFEEVSDLFGLIFRMVI